MTQGEGTGEGTGEGAAAAVADPGALIGDDGKFVTGWQATLPEDIREDPSLKTFSSLDGLAQSYVHAKRMVGANKIAIPSETSTDAEWAEYHAAGGRPETAADYNLERPEGMPEEVYNADLAKAAQELFHKIGLSKKQADALFAFNNDQTLSGLEGRKAAEESLSQQLEADLQKEWGAAFEQKKHMGNIAIEQGTGDNEGFKQRLVDKLGNDPDFVRFAANLGAKFTEHGVVGEAGTLVPTPADIKAKIDEIMQTDAYMRTDHPSHKATVQQVARLFEKRAQSAT